MFVEVPADHFAIFRPGFEGDRRAVRADESLAIVVHKRKKRGLLFRVHFQFSTGVEKHGVKIVEILGVVFQFFFGQDFRVGANGGGPQAGFTAEAFKSSDGMGDRFMAVAFFFRDDQQVFQRLSAGLCRERSPHATLNPSKEQSQAFESGHSISSTMLAVNANYCGFPSQRMAFSNSKFWVGSA